MKFFILLVNTCILINTYNQLCAGCTHEHNREDRMNFVHINENNILTDNHKNFDKKEAVNYGTMSTAYDFRYTYIYYIVQM